MYSDYIIRYSDFITKRLSVPNSGIVFSSSRRSFVSKTGLSFKAELYTDISELKSLCNIIGPYGVKIIDREMLKFVLSNVNTIKVSTRNNNNLLIIINN